MTTSAPVSTDEYLNTSYRPDCDYIDGRVMERSSGEFEHSSLQREILFYLRDHYPALRRRLQPEQRMRVSATRFRIPDICVLAENAPTERVIATPPVLCIEILSPEDTMNRTMERIKDYFAMGVPVCWVIDPVTREGWMSTPGHLLDEPSDRILRAGDIEMALAGVFE